MTVKVRNFGCRLNLAEGDAILQAASIGGGHRATVVINSCAVTAEAMRQARQAVRRAARTQPEARVIVTGCGAQVDPDHFAAMPEVSRVIGNREKRDPAAYAPGINDPVSVGDIMQAAPTFTPVVSGTGHARAFVEVQTGCNHRCTFCIIPQGRGNASSATPAAVSNAVRSALRRGQNEVVLTGVDLSGYDGGSGDTGGLASLVRRLLSAFPDLPRLRLSSIDPADVTPDLIALFANEDRLMPHLHLSLQAGDDLILKRMKRRHSRAQAIEVAAAVRAARPDVAIGADLIAGFPTEDEAMAAQSLALVEECHLVFGHVFPYSPRPGTPAARMPQVAPDLARARAGRLRNAIAQRQHNWLSTLIGSHQTVLVENDGRSGHAPNFAPVALAAPAPPHSLVRTRIIGLRETTLIGVED